MLDPAIFEPNHSYIEAPVPLRRGEHAVLIKQGLVRIEARGTALHFQVAFPWTRETISVYVFNPLDREVNRRAVECGIKRVADSSYMYSTEEDARRYVPRRTGYGHR